MSNSRNTPGALSADTPPSTSSQAFTLLEAYAMLAARSRRGQGHEVPAPGNVYAGDASLWLWRAALSRRDVL